MADKQFDNEMKGSAWVRERHSESSPHYTGDVQIHGEKLRVRVYETGESGSKPALRFYFQNWDEYQAEVEERKAKRGSGQSAPRRAQQQPAQPQSYGNDFIDDETIPF